MALTNLLYIYSSNSLNNLILLRAIRAINIQIINDYIKAFVLENSKD